MNYTDQNFSHVENAYPGFVAIAGPFHVNHSLLKIQRTEKAQCVRALRDQLKTDPEAKIVVVGIKAWVLRKLPLKAIGPMDKFGSSGLIGTNSNRKRLTIKSA